MMRLHRLVFLAALLVFASVHPEAGATIRRTPGSWLFGQRTVFSDGTATPIFHPLSEPMSSAGIINVRVSTELAETSGNCKLRPALRWSDDGIGWGSASAIVATYRTTTGIDYGSAYVDITALGTPKPWVQFGLEVANTTGSRVEVCNGALLVDPKER